MGFLKENKSYDQLTFFGWNKASLKFNFQKNSRHDKYVAPEGNLRA